MAVVTSISPNPNSYTASKSATSMVPESVVAIGRADLTAGFDTTVLRTNRVGERVNYIHDPAPKIPDWWSGSFVEFPGTFYSTESVVDLDAIDGVACRFVVAGAGAGQFFSPALDVSHFELVPEVEQTFSAYFKYTGTESPTIRLVHETYHSAGMYRTYDYGTIENLVDGSYIRISLTFTPSGDLDHFLGFSTTGLFAGETIEMMGLLLEEGSSIAGDAFSGDTEIPGYETEWQTAQFSSASSIYTPVTLTGKPFNLFGGEDMSVEDTRFGKFYGFVESVTESPAGTSFVCYDYAGVFNVTGNIKPSRGTLREYIGSICLTAGMRFPVQMDASIANRTGPWPGYNGILWNHLNELLTAERLEMAFLGNGDLSIRELRSYSLDVSNATDVSRTGSGGSGAVQYVDFVWNRPETYVVDAEIYPTPGEDPQILSVEAGETLVVDLQLSCSVISVNQPSYSEWVESDFRYYDGTNGVYSAAGNDGLPITIDQWYGQGGYLAVETTDDPTVVRVTVKGPSDDSLSPYRIAMTSGEFYNSLRITGDAIRFHQETLRFPTGASPRLVTSTDPRTITSTVARNADQAMYLASRGAEANSGRSLTINVTLPSSNLDFSEVPGSIFSAYNTTWRVDSASISPGGMTVTATATPTAEEFESVWAGLDAGDLESFWANRNDKDFWIEPLES